MPEQRAHRIGPSGIDLAYERFGDPDDPPVLLIMGGGAQMINWPEQFCQALVDHHLHVIRFDNRDSGHSTRFDDAPVPDIAAAAGGDFATASYTLSDLAADTVGLLDHLGIASANLVGASLGGMIGQMVAIEHETRVRTLTSIMSTTGAPGVGEPDFTAFAELGQPPTTKDEFVDWQVRAMRISASPGFEFDESAVKDRAARTFDRGYSLLGMHRQAIATLASGDRTARLEQLTVPTLVIHGDADRMCDLSGGRATAAAIPGAELVVVPGMGHNLPRELWADFATRIADHVTK
ncbi:alpha/beta fold hydrolase [Amycolatopsis rhabdoformis]|uniref:Alpha/beta fold hydrolase n=1 Tax=Amycolatopsis rhabdoformis TaxID=1448059 RepID=A0ABZ1HY66_9PSEU|nr:alpha/beta fold hydrolase [Amycolatopsis rhabdoformis]WSE26900.1 alpha/beta fold hydrolase [Amycolatopsis rhabdoformis]